MSEGIHASTVGNAPGVQSDLLAKVDIWLEYRRMNLARSKRTDQVYRLVLQRLATFCTEKQIPWRDISHDELLVFVGAHLFKLGLKDPASRRPYVACLHLFYAWALQRGHVRKDPAVGIPYPAKPRKIPRAMVLPTAERLMWAPDFATFEGVRDSAILGLLMGCGLRVTGLVRLNDSNLIHDVIDDKPRILLHVREKGDKERLVPIPEQADLLLRVYLEHPTLKEIDRLLDNGDQVLFVSTRNRTVEPHEYRGEKRRMSRGAVLDMIKKYGEEQGLPAAQLHPHALRHLFGTELAEDDVDLITRQKLMGHADPKSTAIYDHLAMRSITRKADKANPLAKINTPASALLKQLKGK